MHHCTLHSGIKVKLKTETKLTTPTNFVGSLDEGTLVNIFLLAKHKGSYSSLLIISRNTVPFVLQAARYLLKSFRFWLSSDLNCLPDSLSFISA